MRNIKGSPWGWEDMEKQTMEEKRCDVRAKENFENFLRGQGFKLETWGKEEEEQGKCPADVFASKGGKKFLFEIKGTTMKEEKRIFGAATMTEWIAALESPITFYFVVAVEDKQGKFAFHYFTPLEFMKCSIIPPMKIDFNLNYTGDDAKSIQLKSVRREVGTVLFKKDHCDVWKRLYDKNKKERKGRTKAEVLSTTPWEVINAIETK